MDTRMLSNPSQTSRMYAIMLPSLRAFALRAVRDFINPCQVSPDTDRPPPRAFRVALAGAYPTRTYKIKYSDLGAGRQHLGNGDRRQFPLGNGLLGDLLQI